MDYIENILGERVRYDNWQHENEMPYYILDRYQIQIVFIGTVKSIFLTPRTELAQMSSVRKHIQRIQMTEFLPVVIVLKSVNRSRRDYLINAKIPFVVPDKQMYLPFMGVALREKYEAEILEINYLQPSAQVLFFYYLYQKHRQLYISDAIKSLRFSAMTISRAVRQLEQTGLFVTKKDGVQKIMIGQYSGEELFQKMQSYLISPVRKILYVDRKENLLRGYTAGLSALAEKGMLNAPEVHCYAVDGKSSLLTGTKQLIDSDRQMAVELWKYDPGILGKEKTVDPLSLAVSLKREYDERVEEAVEEIVKTVWRE